VPLNNAENYEQYILNEGSCVSGDMFVEVQNSGEMQVKFLKPGMKIRGQSKNLDAAWCEIQDVHFIGKGALHGNFTEGHLIFDPSRDEVVRSGNLTQESRGALYTVYTDCPLMENTDGDQFTPLADTFCGANNFTWSEYIVLWTSINQIVSDTGTFWFHLDETFTTCKDPSLCADTPQWRNALPEVCTSLMECASSMGYLECRSFEEVAQTFFHSYVKNETLAKISEAYEKKGSSISESVKESQKDQTHWIYIGVASGLALFGAVLGCFLIYYRKQSCEYFNFDDVEEVNVV